MPTSLIVTQVPPSEFGNGKDPAVVVAPRLVPKMLTIDPGATPVPARKFAPFTTPAAVNVGAAPTATVNGTTDSPEVVRRYALPVGESKAIDRGSNCTCPATVGIGELITDSTMAAD